MKHPHKNAAPEVARRMVHLDLKGWPPHRKRLGELLNLFKRCRYDSVLVEWEDSFPWTVDARFRSETHYTEEEVRSFCDEAEKLGLELVPLVQCLGHMETPLRYHEYAPLREVHGDHDCLNPLAPGARALVERMVEDVLRLMPNTRQFHLGGDESWVFGKHPDTAAYIEKHGKGGLYMHHVRPILDRLHGLGIRPILWGDMMAHWEDGALDEIAPLADLCVWQYDGDLLGKKGPVLERFQKHGITLWGGTAYKGSGIDADLPDVSKRIGNIGQWLEASRIHPLKGLIATAWSRYMTDQMQCEPIDGALDLLAAAGMGFSEGNVPEDWEERARTLLLEAGEWDRQEKIRSLMSEFSRHRTGAWNNIRLLRGYLACVDEDPRRARGPHPRMHLGFLGIALTTMEATAKDLRPLLGENTPVIWVDRFFRERISPVQDELAFIRERMRY